jgi:hypothetical protein
MADTLTSSWLFAFGVLVLVAYWQISSALEPPKAHAMPHDAAPEGVRTS